MKGDKKIIKDPLGYIEITEIGQASRYLVGIDITETVYEDARGNYYIEEWCSENPDKAPLTMIRNSVVELILNSINEKYQEEYQPGEDILDIQELLNKKEDNG